MKLRPVPIVIAVWLLLWINFITRDLFKHGRLEDYKILIASDAYGKHAYTYGERFYEFLKFARESMPEHADYNFAGVKDMSLDSRRGIYYLYPALKNEFPAYILVYNVPGFKKERFRIHAKLDNARFILKRD